VEDLRAAFVALGRLKTAVYGAVDERLRREFGISVGLFETMHVIDTCGVCPAEHLAAELSVSVPAVQLLIHRIEEGGYCRRSPAQVAVELSLPGRRLVAEARAVFEEELRRLLGSAVPVESLQQFSDTLRRLRAAARHVGPARPSAESAASD
jgi:DNA-binding MarR family transcriptional regulator